MAGEELGPPWGPRSRLRQLLQGRSPGQGLESLGQSGEAGPSQRKPGPGSPPGALTPGRAGRRRQVGGGGGDVASESPAREELSLWALSP